MKVEIGLKHLQVRKDQRLLTNHQKLGESDGIDYFPQYLEGTQVCWHIDLGFLVSRTVQQ